MYYFTYLLPSDFEGVLNGEFHHNSKPFKKDEFQKCLDIIRDILNQDGVIIGMYTMG